MTFTELLDHAELAAVQGVRWTVITVSRPPRGERMRLLPGLMGRVLGTKPDGRTIVSVGIADIRRWLVSHLSDVEGLAVMHMERGELEQADAMFAQFVQLRDRLGRLQEPAC